MQKNNRTDFGPEDLITEREAAGYLGISPQWLRCSRMSRPSWAGPRFIKVSQRKVAYRVRHLDEYLAARVIDPADRMAVAS
jgi:hypothetical protein